MRDAAAKALQSMGKRAASALAAHISNSVERSNVSNAEPADGVTKAITVLGKIGKDVADDKEVRKALLSAANVSAPSNNWPRLQLKLAAIDALGQINKYRGSILDKKVSTVFSTTEIASASTFVQKLRDPSNALSKYLWGEFAGDDKAVLLDATAAEAKQRSTLVDALNKILTGRSICDKVGLDKDKLTAQTEALRLRRPTGEYLVRLNRIVVIEAYKEEIHKKLHDLSEIVEASDCLLAIAEKEFHDLSLDSVPAPTPRPQSDKPCTGLYDNLKALHESQPRLVKLAGDVNVDTSSSEEKEPPFPKLVDEKTLGSSLKEIEVACLDASKKIDEKKLWLKKASDKTSSQFQTESAYGLLTETRQLNTDLHSLDKAVVEFKANQDDLNALTAALAEIPEMAPSQSASPRNQERGEISGPNLIRASVGNALNQIFSKPPKKKTAATAAKKDQTKKEAEKKDSEKKGDDKKATDKKDSDKQDSNNTEVEEDETANE